MKTPENVLVGDVGGTNARFAIVEIDETAPWRVHSRFDIVTDHPTFTAALKDYFERSGAASVPPVAAIAVAGPVIDGRARFTNRRWDISEQELGEFGFEHALLINDFGALAIAAEELGKNDLCTIGPDFAGIEGAPISILGPGTGFGVALLARAGGRRVPIATEGGHIGFAPGDDREAALLQSLRRQYGRVSVERILSGPGLESVYAALRQLDGRGGPDLAAPQISAGAASGDAACVATLSMFCAIFGAVAGDLALAHGARGGVYLAGGIAQKIQAFLAQSEFRSRFEDKGRLSPYVQKIPTRLIMNDDAALLGAARAGLDLTQAAAAG